MIGRESRPDDAGSVEAQLRRWAKQLHDLSGRNRLLYYHETRSSSATFEEPAFEELFCMLVERGQVLTVPLPSQSEILNQPADDSDSMPLSDLAELSDLLPQAEDRQDDLQAAAATMGAMQHLPASSQPGRGATRQKETSRSKTPPKKKEIRTNLTPAHLHRVLYNLRYAARTVREEQGLNILYATFGMLRWRELRNAAWSLAPMLLVPVVVERERPNLPYRIRMEEGEAIVNPVLQIKLLRDFGTQLPEQLNELSVAELRRFIENSRERISAHEGWDVEERATLGAFSFLTLLLIKDFENHKALYTRHPLVRWLSGLHPEPINRTDAPPEASELDEVVDPGTVFQVLDADSSQQEAIEAAKRGLSFILQGPPGTGKSQTITNLIAESIMAGKKVLFVSQKMAALEVVQQRLARKGLAEFCLEIHSHRMDKRRVVQELMSSLAASTVHVSNPQHDTRRRELGEIRHELNQYVKELHEPRPALGLSLYELHGRLSQLLDAPEVEFDIAAVDAVSSSGLAQMLRSVRELAGYGELIRARASSPWRGFALEQSTIGERERIGAAFRRTSQSILELTSKVDEILSTFALPDTENLQNVLELAQVLTCFRSGVFSPALEGPVLRYRGHGLSNGRFLSLQYESDAEKLGAVLRSDVQPTTREIAMAMATVRRFVRDRRRDLVHGGSGLELGQDLPEMNEHLRQIEGGYAEARRLFRADEMPAVLTELYGQPPRDAAAWFSEHSQATGELQQWANLNAVCAAAGQRGLGDFVERVFEAQLRPEAIEAAFSRRFYELLIESLSQTLPMFQRFKGQAHAELIGRFRTLDEEMISTAANDIRAHLHRNKPQRSWMTAGSAETSVLRREHNKRRRLKPLRRLFGEVPTLIQALKPCLMMSPLTVCQLLDPEVHQFDLVVFDEASQIPPEYAVSAFLRARQVVISGDRQQLPPMDFFQAMEGDALLDDEANPEDESEFESILTLCDSRGFPNKMLNWHYRSRDESLIAYSNRHFYDGRLLTFPNSRFNNPSTGLKFVHVEDGVYESGETRRYNLREASRVADLTLEVLNTHPGLSIGIVAFGAPQRRAIENAVDRLRLQHPEINPLLQAQGREPLFIKNLENVQGDERDVIILSVGYGPDANGRFAMNFGPLTRDGGARRLNVAVTRARHLLYLVASIQPEDIDLRRAASRGASLLRDYLVTARDGIRGLTPKSATSEDADGDCDFEEAVFQSLTALGLDLVRKVGASEYRIDLAVRDPQDEGHFLLGLECDGRTYRSAMTTRDRDRLRQQVLEGLGWRIHRIWSQDWIRDREGEIRKVMELVRAAAENPGAAARASATAPARRERTADSDLYGATTVEPAPGSPAGALPYREYALPVPAGRGKAALLASPLSGIIDELQALAHHEGPISIEMAKTKVIRSWQARSDAQVLARLEGALRAGVAQGAFRLNGGFLWPLGLTIAPLRIHSAGGPKRTIDEISPEEIAEGLRACVKSAITITRQDLIREAARLFGLRTSDSNAGRIEAVLGETVRDGVLRDDDGRIGLGAGYSGSRMVR